MSNRPISAGMHAHGWNLGGTVLPVERLAVCALLGTLFFYSPLITLLLACLLCASIPHKSSDTVMLIAACLLFTVLNISKEIAADLANYLSEADYLAGRSFAILFSPDQIVPITGSYRVSELGFHAPLWLLVNLFQGGAVIIAILGTLGTYVPSVFALRVIAREERWSRAVFMNTLLFTLLAGINFVETTHLLRQYLSSSIAFLAFAYFLAGRKWVSLVIAALACTVHNGTVLLVPDVLLLAWALPYRRRGAARPIATVLRVMVAVAGIGATLALVFIREDSHVGLTEGTLTPLHFLLVGAVFCTFWALSTRNFGHSAYRHYVGLAFVTVYGVSLCFYILNIQLLALRYFVYLDWIYGLMIAGILRSIPDNRLAGQILCRWGTATLVILVFIWRLQSSPWTYGPGQLEILTLDAPQLARVLGG